MPKLFANGARTTLAAPITAAATSLTLVNTSRFPVVTLGGGDWFDAVLEDSGGFEIVRVERHEPGTFGNVFSNVVRAQYGTTALALAAGATVGLRPLASDMAYAYNAAALVNARGTVGGVDLLANGAADIPVGDVLYGTPDPDNAGGRNGDVYIQSNGKLWKKASGIWTYTGIQFAAQTTATTITRTGGVITSMTETVGGTSRVTTITRSGGVVTQIAVAHNGITRTETLTRTGGRVTGITVTET